MKEPDCVATGVVNPPPDAATIAHHHCGMGSYYRAEMSGFAELNASIVAGFRRNQDASDVRKTHFFQDRFENIYMAQSLTPGIEAVLEQARDHAQTILSRHATLKLGYWFNAMQPGDATLPHSHGDDQELLSGVYYLSVPKSSGELLLGEGLQMERITPREGQFVFFSPEMVHAVDTHLGTGLRLSIGMNFGL